MLRVSRRAPGAVVATCLAAGAASLATGATPAAADPFQIGGWLGPHFFSDDAALGYIPTAPDHPVLSDGVVIGARLSRPIRPWLVPEVELPFVLTTTDRFDTSVLWLQPRVHARFEFLPRAPQVRPFVLVGAGATFAVSSKSRVFATDATGDAYFGIGAHAITGRGFQLRGDFRIAVAPGVQKRAVLEFEVGIGLWVELGPGAKRSRRGGGERPPIDPDPDRDGILGDADRCPDRAEDVDGHEDGDGCPDIDNDLDGVLDIADQCPSVSESTNGYEDDDGCPDTLPPELDDLDGTVEGLTYQPGQSKARAAARRRLKKIAEVLTKYPSVRITLTGHTDDREGAIDLADLREDEEPPDLARELSIERAAVLKAILVGYGVAEGRIAVDGKAALDPVGDNEQRRGRQANRRVVLKRVVPPP